MLRLTKQKKVLKSAGCTHWQYSAEIKKVGERLFQLFASLTKKN